MSLLVLGGVIVGAILGVAIHRVIGTVYATDPVIYNTFTMRDALVLILGAAMYFVGGRVHAVVRYMGIGMVAWQVGHELEAMIWV